MFEQQIETGNTTERYLNINVYQKTRGKLILKSAHREAEGKLISININTSENMRSVDLYKHHHTQLEAGGH